MTDDEIIDVVSAHKAGMRIEWLYRSQWLGVGVNPRWNFHNVTYRVNPKDAGKWERIKKGKTMTLGTKFRIYRADPDPPQLVPLPPLPENAVVLPECIVKPEGVDAFEGWAFGFYCFNKAWEYGAGWCGLGNPKLQRYAVRSDTEIARVNGVGLGPCPTPHGWHNPDGLTPQQVGVPEYRLLCRDEVGGRGRPYPCISRWIDFMNRWEGGYRGGDQEDTYRTRLPYGELPPVTKHTFPECAPKRVTKRVPLWAGDFRLGQGLRMKHQPEIAYAITRIDTYDDEVYVAGEWRCVAELQRNWERHNADTGAWDGCWREVEE